MRRSIIDNALMNTLPPEWPFVITDRPSVRHGSARRAVRTSWRACPLSSAWDRAITRGDHRLLQSVDRVAAEWNRMVNRTPLRWLSRIRSVTVRVPAEDCAAVAAAVGTDVLERTLTHIELLRRRRRPRRGLRAVALLEWVETAVVTELEVRRAAARARRRDRCRE